MSHKSMSVKSEVNVCMFLEFIVVWTLATFTINFNLLNLSKPFEPFETSKPFAFLALLTCKTKIQYWET